MKRWWVILAVLLVLTAVGIWLLSRANPPLLALQKVQRTLRKDGFKIELQEFDFSLSPELSRRAALLGRTSFSELTNRLRPDPIMGDMRDFPELVTYRGDSSAIPAWKFSHLESDRGDLWPALRDTLEKSRARWEAARLAAVSGPIRFRPIGAGHPNPLLPYLADVKSLATTFGVLTELALHDGNKEEAWTNLLAVTCLATAYEPEPIEISHLCRFGFVEIAFNATWSTLQQTGWTDAQLSALQTRWEGLDLWRNLSETPAYSRANAAALCELDRRLPISLGLSFLDILRNPRDAWFAFSNYRNQMIYRARGSYEDEISLLLYYRDREMELRQAVRDDTWEKMRDLRGTTNVVPFSLSKSSRVAARMNMRQLTLAFSSHGVGLLGRAAEAEARRRLMIAALALERYHARHGSYPRQLSELVPDLLEVAPTDFMDGQPLRYRLTEDGHFLLYSVGLDCADNGGLIRSRARRGIPTSGIDFGFPQGTDLVWPRPASASEIAQFEAAERREREFRMKSAEDAQAQAWWNITSRRQLNAEQALASPPAIPTNEPVIGGRPLAEIISNDKSTNRPSLVQLLTLKPVVTGAEPETVAFELPIRYEALTNVGELMLCIDRYGPDYEEGWAVGHYECVPATNGNCRLLWSTIYETPGKHALLAGLDLKDAADTEGVFGPAIPFVVSNLCQFTPESAFFERDRGAKFYARLAEPHGTVKLELKSAAGESLRTITGTTTNGFLEIRWDLTDDHGARCTNDSYDSVFHINLPDSGRSQTLRGP